jgi:tetratricopeptide (TPR) repeat protein
MFANHIFLKADAYFHSGYYPSIFDNRESFQTAHMAADAGALEETNTGDEHAFLGEPLDWIDAFGREFFPSRHTHLDEDCADPDHHCDHDHEEAPDEEIAEILPWLRMSVELDPHRVESYMVAAYWLRERMDRVDEAEQFLREGLRANPDSYEILFELGRLSFDARKDNARARTLWLLATERWKSSQLGKPEPEEFILRQIMSYRALLEEQEGHPERALECLKLGRELSGGNPVFDGRIQRLEAALGAPKS